MGAHETDAPCLRLQRQKALRAGASCHVADKGCGAIDFSQEAEAQCGAQCLQYLAIIIATAEDALASGAGGLHLQTSDLIREGKAMRLTRRSFFGHSAAFGALAAMPSLASAHSFLTEPLLDASSRLTATHWGIIRAFVESGRLTRVEPFKKDSFAPSPVIQAFMDRVYSPSRVKYPMVRKNFLKNGVKSDRTERGRGDFVRVSWDDAFNLVASELQRVKKEHGNTALHAGSTDWHSVGKLHNSPVLVRRMLGLHGGFVDNTGDFSIAAAMVILPHVIGGTEVYDQPSAWPRSSTIRPGRAVGQRPVQEQPDRLGPD